MAYHPISISKVIKNSILNYKEGIKSGRLDGSNRSFQEAELGNTKRGTRSSGRILIGLDDSNELIILDGRHLLEAYRLLEKEIPNDTISFESNEAYEIFIKEVLP